MLRCFNVCKVWHGVSGANGSAGWRPEMLRYIASRLPCFRDSGILVWYVLGAGNATGQQQRCASREAACTKLGSYRHSYWAELHLAKKCPHQKSQYIQWRAQSVSGFLCTPSFSARSWQPVLASILADLQVRRSVAAHCCGWRRSFRRFPLHSTTLKHQLSFRRTVTRDRNSLLPNYGAKSRSISAPADW
jgi:hypothetical protein